jgi:hypothetical protein
MGYSHQRAADYCPDPDWNPTCQDQKAQVDDRADDNDRFHNYAKSYSEAKEEKGEDHGFSDDC